MKIIFLKKIYPILLLLSSISIFSFAQNSINCGDIKELFFGEPFHNPNGISKKLDLFKNDYTQIPKYFQEEHNLFFYEFTALESGLLTLNIYPQSENEDYDFILFQSDNSCDNLFKNLESPLRSNLSRNDKKNRSVTGLDLISNETHVGIGIGNNFSKALKIQKGEKYYLVLDNVYSNGNGHKIELKLNSKVNKNIYKIISKKIILSLLTNERTRPLKGRIEIENISEGVKVFEKKIHSTIDTFEFSFKENNKYFIYAYADSFLFNSTEIDPIIVQNKLDIFLDTLLLGRKFTLYNIKFKPNSSDIVSSAELDLSRLKSFLINNPKYFIEIQGHTNYNIFSDRNYLLDLSFRRAKEIKNYLIKNGISESRINCTGMGGSAPLVVSDDQKIAMKNLRVEIVLIDKE